jgi:putative transposase
VPPIEGGASTPRDEQAPADPYATVARRRRTSVQTGLGDVHLVTRRLDPTGTGRTRWTMRWKPVIDAFAITFSDRRPGAETY